MYTIQITKDDLKFINGAATGYYKRYVLSSVCVYLKNNKMRFETSDTKILIRRSFDLTQEDLPDQLPENKLIIPIEFFKKILYLYGSSKNMIEISVDFEKRYIVGKSEWCEIHSKDLDCGKFPNTDIYPDDMIKENFDVIFTKSILEKLLKATSDKDPHIKFSFKKEKPWRTSVVVRTGKNEKWSDNDNSNIIMLVEPVGEE